MVTRARWLRSCALDGYVGLVSGYAAPLNGYGLSQWLRSCPETGHKMRLSSTGLGPMRWPVE